jgi:UTP:GlnB (protein PII) uridylyltransferase
MGVASFIRTRMSTLLILLPHAADTALERQLEQLIGILWDIGLEVGHSVRTIDECVGLAAEDITVQTTLLEARLLAGSRELFNRFVTATSSALEPQAFLDAKQLEQQQRHARYQETNLGTEHQGKRRRIARPANDIVDRARGEPRQELERACAPQPDR